MSLSLRNDCEPAPKDVHDQKLLRDARGYTKTSETQKKKQNKKKKTEQNIFDNIHTRDPTIKGHTKPIKQNTNTIACFYFEPQNGNTCHPCPVVKRADLQTAVSSNLCRSTSEKASFYLWKVRCLIFSLRILPTNSQQLARRNQNILQEVVNSYTNL